MNPCGSVHPIHGYLLCGCVKTIRQSPALQRSLLRALSGQQSLIWSAGTMSTDIAWGTWHSFTGFVNVSLISVCSFAAAFPGGVPKYWTETASVNSKPVRSQKLADDKICFARVSNLNLTILVFKIPFFVEQILQIFVVHWRWSFQQHKAWRRFWWITDFADWT